MSLTTTLNNVGDSTDPCSIPFHLFECFLVQYGLTGVRLL